MTNQTKDECAILTEVLLNELDCQFLVGVPLELLHESEVFLDVTVTVGLEGGTKDPREEGEAGHCCDENHPEPDEEVDLLIEQVDGKNTLDGVVLDVTKATDFEVTHGDTGETWGSGPV